MGFFLGVTSRIGRKARCSQIPSSVGSIATQGGGAGVSVARPLDSGDGKHEFEYLLTCTMFSHRRP